jgi:glycolate oxidase FAD binding subunit
MSEAALGALQDRIRNAAAAKTPLVIRGGGTRDFYGEAIVGEVLDTTSFEGIVDYDPTELVVTARAGTRVADIDATLAARGQMLGCDAPRLGAGPLLAVSWRRVFPAPARRTRAPCAISSLACVSSTARATISRSVGA